MGWLLPLIIAGPIVLVLLICALYLMCRKAYLLKLKREGKIDHIGGERVSMGKPMAHAVQNSSMTQGLANQGFGMNSSNRQQAPAAPPPMW